MPVPKKMQRFLEPKVKEPERPELVWPELSGDVTWPRCPSCDNFEAPFPCGGAEEGACGREHWPCCGHTVGGCECREDAADEADESLCADGYTCPGCTGTGFGDCYCWHCCGHSEDELD
jgi:hypothetical protein